MYIYIDYLKEQMHRQKQTMRDPKEALTALQVLPLGYLPAVHITTNK